MTIIPSPLRWTVPLVLAAACAAWAQEDPLDGIEDRLAFGDDTLRFQLSGTLDLEGYYLRQPDPGLIPSEHNPLFNPRLSLFLDAQLGPRLYAFVESRADDGFDPGGPEPSVRLDEYALRLTPLESALLSIQVGKFAAVVGNWALRHGSWDNPFITAPLPYEDLTGLWDTTGARSTSEVMVWAGLQPKPSVGGAYLVEYRNIPIIWGPSYASGASAFGRDGAIEYAIEVKNSSLSSRPETWSSDEGHWRYPTVSGRVGWDPDPMWSFGLSASSGPYLERSAEDTLLPGRGFGSYRESVLGQDVAFAWHHVQIWAEAYETRFEIPGVANADAEAWYVEAKYKFTPRFSTALRWNQEYFSSLYVPGIGPSPWGRDVERLDLAPAFRLNPHAQIKLQYSLEHEDADLSTWGQLFAVQLTLRF